MYPEVPIVLINITGMWGSRFSWASKRYTRWKTENMRWTELVKDMVKMILFNFMFFIPKRQVTIEFNLAGKDFPRTGTRLEINKWLESLLQLTVWSRGRRCAKGA